MAEDAGTRVWETAHCGGRRPSAVELPPNRQEQLVRFTLFEPTALSPHHLLRLSREVEACGFDTVALNDGTFQIRNSRGDYPYTEDHQPNGDLEAGRAGAPG